MGDSIKSSAEVKINNIHFSLISAGISLQKTIRLVRCDFCLHTSMLTTPGHLILFHMLRELFPD